jgi:hypothetical protein
MVKIVSLLLIRLCSAILNDVSDETGCPIPSAEYPAGDPVTITFCRVEQLVARHAHNVKVDGSSPFPATKCRRIGAP